MKTYTEKEVVQLLKEQRELCANIAMQAKYFYMEKQDFRAKVALAPVPSAMRYLNSESVSSDQG